MSEERAEYTTYAQAVTQIARLEAENARLRGALEQIIAEPFGAVYYEGWGYDCPYCENCKDIAKAALSGSTEAGQ